MTREQWIERALPGQVCLWFAEHTTNDDELMSDVTDLSLEHIKEHFEKTVGGFRQVGDIEALRKAIRTRLAN